MLQSLLNGVPLGLFDNLEARGVDKTGTPNMGGTIATAEGLIFVGGTIDRRFRAFDAETGAMLWETTLEASAHATPMTYLGRDGRQYVAIAAAEGFSGQNPVEDRRIRTTGQERPSSPWRHVETSRSYSSATAQARSSSLRSQGEVGSGKRRETGTWGDASLADALQNPG